MYWKLISIVKKQSKLILERKTKYHLRNFLFTKLILVNLSKP